MLKALTDKWWTLLLRGLAAIAFGFLLFARPGRGLYALVLAFGAYAIVNGVLNLVYAASRHPVSRLEGDPRGWLVFEGLAGIALGVATLIWPGITAVALLICIAAWCIATGLAEIFEAIELRRVIKGEFFLILAGVLSVAFGVLLLARPGTGALAVTLWIAAYAVLFGGVLVGLSFRIRSFGREEEKRRVPPGGIPAAA